MYKTTVLIRENIKDKTMIKLFMPLGIWFLSFLVSLYIAIKIAYLVIILVGIILIGLIPLTIWMIRKALDLRKASFINKEVIFDVIDRKLYTNNIQLIVEYDKSVNEIYVYHMSQNGICTFFATIQEAYVQDFIEFLIKNSVTINILQE